MSKFTDIFGIEKDSIKKNCVLAPFLSKDLVKSFGVKKLESGKLYSAQASDELTLIRTGIGASLLGDCILYLNDSPCENIFLIGACGLTKTDPNLTVGNIIAPITSYSFESFSDLLTSDLNIKSYSCSENLLEGLFTGAFSKDVTAAISATFGSINLEEKNLDLFSKLNITALDMECSALFSASAAIKRNAIALLYATDIIGETPFHKKVDGELKDRIDKSEKKIVEIIKDLCQTNR